MPIKKVHESNANNSNTVGMYAFFDTKGNRYDTPFFCQNDLFASRHYKMVSEKEGTMMHTFKNEFNLERLGWFDLQTGGFEDDVETIIFGQALKDEEK